MPRSIPMTFPIRSLACREPSGSGHRLVARSSASSARRRFRNHHARRTQQSIAQPVALLQHVRDAAGRNRSVLHLREGLVEVRIERLPLRPRSARPRAWRGPRGARAARVRRPATALEVLAAELAEACSIARSRLSTDGEQVLDDVLVPVAERLLLLAERALRELSKSACEPDVAVLRGSRFSSFSGGELALERLALRPCRPARCGWPRAPRRAASASRSASSSSALGRERPARGLLGEAPPSPPRPALRSSVAHASRIAPLRSCET